MDKRTEQLISHFMLLTEEQKVVIEKLILAFLSGKEKKQKKTI